MKRARQERLGWNWPDKRHNAATSVSAPTAVDTNTSSGSTGGRLGTGEPGSPSQKAAAAVWRPAVEELRTAISERRGSSAATSSSAGVDSGSGCDVRRPPAPKKGVPSSSASQSLHGTAIPGAVASSGGGGSHAPGDRLPQDQPCEGLPISSLGGIQELSSAAQPQGSTRSTSRTGATKLEVPKLLSSFVSNAIRVERPGGAGGRMGNMQRGPFRGSSSSGMNAPPHQLGAGDLSSPYLGGVASPDPCGSGPTTASWANSVLGATAVAANHDGFIGTRNVILFDRTFRWVAVVGVSLWLFLLRWVYKNTPPEQFVYLEPVERGSALAAAALIMGAMLAKVIPLLVQPGRRCGSGLLLGAISVQIIASMTNLLMATCPSPVMVDPVTGANVYPFRYCEWTPLAFMMTFFTEGANVPADEDESEDEDEEEEDYMDGEVGSFRRRVAEAKSAFRRWYKSSQVYWKLLRNAVLLALSQCLSALPGLIFPYCTTFLMWFIVMVISCVLYLVLFPRVYYRRKALQRMEHGVSVDENEMYERVRLSYRLLLTCTGMWTILVVAYFFGAFAHWFVAPTSVFAHRSLPFVVDAIIDVMAKALYMDIIAEVHKNIFDDAARSTRRLEELRQMMSAVWECSSDVIAVSVRGQGKNITTMLSPTFHKIEYLSRPEDERDDAKLMFSASGELDTKPIVFEMKIGTEGTSSSARAGDGGGKSSSSGDCTKNAGATDPDVGALYWVDLTDDGSMSLRDRNFSPEGLPALKSISSLMAKAWTVQKRECLLVHDIQLRNGASIQCEAKATRLGENALLVVMRDISERFMCFEAEKKAVFESTARQKDAEANRFTRHEVKNGLLASIGICDSLREALSAGRAAAARSQIVQALAAAPARKGDGVFNYISDLDTTLRDILDTVLAEAMARDVIHEVYEPKLERVDLEVVLSAVQQGKENRKRFPLVTNPNPLPIFMFDPQLLKYIHRNAISNACKYGKKGGVVVTEVQFNAESNELLIQVINLPGDNHDQLVMMGDEATNIVFSPGRRLHTTSNANGGSSGKASHSAGDGAWISRKCAKTLGGECSIRFERDRTVFALRCPAKPYDVVLKLFPGAVGDPSNFCLPDDTWGVAIDDSKIQRKLMHRFFTVAGIPEDRQVLLGKNADEIRGFTSTMEELIKTHSESYFLVIADENLDIVEDNNHCHTISGSLCLQKLRRKLDSQCEQRMLTLVRSANDSASDVAIYNSRAHGFICKAPIQREKIMEMLAPIWARRFASRFPNSMVRCKSSEDMQPGFDPDTNMTTAVDLMQTVEVIDALCIQNENLLAIRWPILWEKLVSLKGDLARLDDSQTASESLRAINEFEGSSLPSNFTARWAGVRSQIIRII